MQFHDCLLSRLKSTFLQLCVRFILDNKHYKLASLASVPGFVRLPCVGESWRGLFRFDRALQPSVLAGSGH